MREFSTIRSIQEALHSGQVSCVALVQHYLQQIEAQASLNAFVEVYAQEALSKAADLDIRLRTGKVGKLAGLVIGVKDVLCQEGKGVQAGSHILTQYRSPYTATALQRLLDEDAIVIGRQNCDEFAMGSSNESSYFGPVLNAANPQHVPGGSSGGSAVAVQAGMCHASLGSDTGGSVRQPAAFCGTYGFKPSYGRISRWGLLAYASSFDCIGPITKSIDDAALLLEIMAGADEHDSTVSNRPVPTYSSSLSWSRPARVGYLRDSVENEAIDPDIREATRSFIEHLRSLGHTVEPLDLKLLPYYLPTYYILTTAEASSNLSRYDGIRYGLRASDALQLTDLYKQSRTKGFGSEVRKRILLGTFVLSANYYDAYYTKAQRVRQLIKKEVDEAFGQFDFILSATTPTTAFRLGEKTTDPLQMYLADIFTVQANLVGATAVSFPMGNDEQGLPIGLQLTSPAYEEEALLSFVRSVVPRE